MSHNIELKEGAILISDAHYSHRRPQLLELLQKIESREIQTPQLVLMGDIFDALFGGISDTYEKNVEMIALLRRLSQKVKTLYLEGNHDFNLSKLFPDIELIPFAKQPLVCSYGKKRVALSHGDFDISGGYRLYAAVIRNPFLLFFLNILNKIGRQFILKKLDAYLGKKEDCNDFTHFESYIKKRSLDSFNVDYFIEGHYHQNKLYDFRSFEYINLGAFACNQRYFIVKSTKENNILQEKKLS